MQEFKSRMKDMITLHNHPCFVCYYESIWKAHILEDISQSGLDRMIIFDIKGRNEIGDPSHKQLIVEIMGRHSNIILIDKTRNMILDSIKHVSLAVNTYRSVLPGQEYIFPPEQHKANPFEADEQDVLRRLDFNAGKLDKQIVSQLCWYFTFAGKRNNFSGWVSQSDNFAKCFSFPNGSSETSQLFSLHYGESDKEHFYIFPLESTKARVKSFPTLGEMLDRFYFGKSERDRVKQQATDIERLIMNEKEKNEKKIAKLEVTLLEANQAPQFQLFGELLTANLFAVKKGMKEIEVVNYYDENGSTILIPLNPLKTPSENAQRYFTKYQKAKTAVQIVQEQIEKARDEVIYFDALIQQVETASPKDIAEIREELMEEGYIRNRQKKQNKKPHATKPVLDRFYASDETEIIIGKNNKQNDYLTNRLAARDEIWLHTKDIPGSHVVIRSKEPSEKTIHEAAILAAFFSKARHSSSVPVDFTRVRYVKKPAGAKPGFVIYENQQTVFVTPDEETVVQLKKH